jgi:hypothetical protein
MIKETTVLPSDVLLDCIETMDPRLQHFVRSCLVHRVQSSADKRMRCRMMCRSTAQY